MSVDTYYDGDFTVARAVGAIRTEQPFDHQPGTLIYRQTFWQLAANYVALDTGKRIGLGDGGGVLGLPTPTGPVTFTLKYNGSAASAAIPIPCTAAQLKTAFEALSTVGAGNSSITDVTASHGDAFLDVLKIELVGALAGSPNAKPTILVQAPAGYSIVVEQFSVGQRANNIQRLIIRNPNAPGDSSGSNNDTGKIYLVQETPRRDVGSGIVEWDRVWATVPNKWSEYPCYNYQAQRAQYYTVPWSGATDVFGRFQGTYRTFVRLAEWTEPLIATVTYSYVFVPSGTSNLGNLVKAVLPYRIIHFTDSFGQEYVYQVGTRGVAEATSSKRWMGNIFEVKNVYVNPYLT